MKKKIAMILCASMAFASLVACSSDNTKDKKDKKDKSDKEIESVDEADDDNDSNHSSGNANSISDELFQEDSLGSMLLDPINIKDYDRFETVHNDILDGTIIDLCFDYYDNRTIGLKANGDIVIVDKHDSTMRFIANIPNAKEFYSDISNGYCATVVTNDGTIYLMPCDYEYEGDPIKLEVQDNIKYLALATGFMDDKLVINYLEVFEKDNELFCDYIGCNSDISSKDMKVIFDNDLDPDRTLTYSFFNANGNDFIADSNGQTYRVFYSQQSEDGYKIKIIPNAEDATKDNIKFAIDSNPIYLRDNTLVKNDSYLGETVIELGEDFDMNNVADVFNTSGAAFFKMNDGTIYRIIPSFGKLDSVHTDICHQIKEIAGDYILSTDGEIYWQ